MSERSLAFNPEMMRQQMWEGVTVPPAMIEEALSELRKQISATKVQYFAHQGQVRSRRVVADNEARLSAIRTTLKIADAEPYHYAKDEGKSDGAVLEIGADGVYRLRIGNAAAMPPLERKVPNEVKQLTPGSGDPVNGEPLVFQTRSETPEMPEVLKVRSKEDMRASFVEPDATNDGCIP